MHFWLIITIIIVWYLYISNFGLQSAEVSTGRGKIFLVFNQPQQLQCQVRPIFTYMGRVQNNKSPEIYVCRWSCGLRGGRMRQAGKKRPPMQERGLSGVRTQIHDITLGLVHDILSDRYLAWHLNHHLYCLQGAWGASGEVDRKTFRGKRGERLEIAQK